MIKYLVIIVSLVFIYQMLFLHFIVLRKPKNGASEIRKFKSTKIINGKAIKIKKITHNNLLLSAYMLLILNLFYIGFLLANAVIKKHSYDGIIIGWEYLLPIIVLIYSCLLCIIYYRLKSETIKQFFKNRKWLILSFLILEIILMTYSSVIVIYLFKQT